MHYFPLALPFILVLFVLVGVLIGLLEIGVISYAYEKIGIDRRYVFALLLATLVGSYFNIPVAELPAERVVSDQVVSYFGMHYIVPLVQEWPRTVIAINVGGAVVPTLVSAYLLWKTRLFGRTLAAVAIVAVAVHLLARPVPGVGIAVPTLAPPVLAAVTALLLARRSAPAVAYVAGALGTLIGADLLNLGNIQGLGAPIASIGGAGTFDGIFLTAIIAVLLA